MVERPGVESLKLHECWELLRSVQVGRLAVVHDGQPEIFPINFVVDHGTLVFRTARGSKLSAVQDGAHVAFEADGLDGLSGIAWSVIAKGRAVVVANPQERFEAMSLPLYPWEAAPKHHFVRITPETLTGRRFPRVAPASWSVPTFRRAAAE